MKQKKNSIIIFTKTPTLGKVKTRLVKSSKNNIIDHKKALNIHIAFFKDTISKVENILECEKYIFFRNFTENLTNANEFSLVDNFKIHSQEGNNLGERMYNAFLKIINIKNDKVLIIGTDSPTLPENFITNAFNILENNDIVIGPTFDGGYYLIGMKGYAHNLFSDIKWGTNKVFGKTVEKTIKKGLKFSILPPWYDVDTSNDISFLNDHLIALENSGEFIPKNTINTLREMKI